MPRLYQMQTGFSFGERIKTGILLWSVEVLKLNELRAGLGTKRQTRVDRAAYGTIWPNGEFSLCWPKQKMDETNQRLEDGEKVFTSNQKLVSTDTLASLCDEIHTEEEALAFYPPPKRKNGLKGITRYGKKFVRSGAALLQRKYSRFRLSFLTLTLPELSREDGSKVAQNWGRVVNRFLQWLRRSLIKVGLPTTVVGSTEVQPSRSQSGSINLLHVHLVFVGRMSSHSTWLLSPNRVRRAWLSILSNEVGHTVHSTACEELRMVKKSAEGYLGKYMSKGSEAVAELVANGDESMVPGQWWFSTKEMRDWVKSEILKGPKTGALLESLVEYLNDGNWEGSGVWGYPCHVELSGVPMLVAWVGRLPKTLWVDLTSMLKFSLS